MSEDAEVKQEETGPQVIKVSSMDMLLAMMAGMGQPIVFTSNGDPYIKEKMEQDKEAEETALGDKEYYILVPDTAVPMSIGSCMIHAWITEYSKGYKPDYKGHKKHRILPEQFDWLNKHKDCPIMAWYDAHLPVYAAVACQQHKSCMIPVVGNPKTYLQTADLNTTQVLQEGKIVSQPENIWTEEREI